MNSRFKEICADIEHELSCWGEHETEPHVSQLRMGRRITYSALLYGKIILNNEIEEDIVKCYSFRCGEVNVLAYEVQSGNIYFLVTPYMAYWGYFDKEWVFHSFAKDSSHVFDIRTPSFEVIRQQIEKLRKKFFLKSLTSFFRKRKRILQLSVFNLGHHIWNEQSGIDYLISSGLIKMIDKFVFYIDYFNISKMLRQNYHIKSSFTKKGFMTRDIVINPSVQIYQKRTTSRLLDFCLSNANINHLKLDDKFVIVMCIRSNIRVWLQEKEGLACIINDISDQYKDKNILFLIDGFSIPAGSKLPKTAEVYINNDKKEYQKILSCVSSNYLQNVKSIIGYNCVDKVAIYNKAKILVMPYGTPEHYNWIVEKPIITYGPQAARNLSNILNGSGILSQEGEGVVINNTAVPVEKIEEFRNLNYSMDYKILENLILEKLNSFYKGDNA